MTKEITDIYWNIQYEPMIDEAKLSFLRNEELLKVVDTVCFDNWLDKKSIWAIRECFLQKQ